MICFDFTSGLCLKAGNPLCSQTTGKGVKRVNLWASGVVNKCGEFGTEQETEHRHFRVRSTLTVVVVIVEKDLRIFERRRKMVHA